MPPTCRNVIAENARKRGQAWSLCAPCAQAIEDDTCQLEIEPALIPRCLVCRTDIAQLRAGARTCGDACRNVLSRLLRGRRCPGGEPMVTPDHPCMEVLRSRTFTGLARAANNPLRGNLR